MVSRIHSYPVARRVGAGAIFIAIVLFALAPAAGTAGNAPTSAAPGAPTGVWAAAKASTTGAKTKQNITVHWALVQGAKRYVVQWSKDGTRVAGSASSRGTRASTPALARQTWKVRVAAISPGKKTVYSTWIDVPRV